MRAEMDKTKITRANRKRKGKQNTNRLEK